MIPLWLVSLVVDPGPPGVSLNGAQLTIGVLGTLGVGSVLAAIINGLWTRKKLGADATEIITKAASGVVENLNADNVRLRSELDDERQDRIRDKVQFKVDREADRVEFRRIIAEHAATLQEHAAWDHLAASRLEEVGIAMPPPPALYSTSGSPSSLKEFFDAER